MKQTQHPSLSFVTMTRIMMILVAFGCIVQIVQLEHRAGVVVSEKQNSVDTTAAPKKASSTIDILYEIDLPKLVMATTANSTNNNNNDETYYYYPTDVVPANMQRSSRYRVPHQLIFVGKNNILQQRRPKAAYRNIQQTIEAYRSAWNEPNAPVWFLDDNDCEKLIGYQNTTLLELFQNETRGPFKSDICRAVALYLVGGYYFDNDIAVMNSSRPYIPPNHNTSFVTVTMKDERFVCQCILIAERRSPIMRTSFDTMGEWYQNKTNRITKKMKNWMGPWAVKTAIVRNNNNKKQQQQQSHNFNDEVILMREQLLDDEYDPNHTLPRQKFKFNLYGKRCNQAIGLPNIPSDNDPRPMDPYFWTRQVGLTDVCK